MLNFSGVRIVEKRTLNVSTHHEGNQRSAGTIGREKQDQFNQWQSELSHGPFNKKFLARPKQSSDDCYVLELSAGEWQDVNMFKKMGRDISLFSQRLQGEANNILSIQADKVKQGLDTLKQAYVNYLSITADNAQEYNIG